MISCSVHIRWSDIYKPGKLDDKYGEGKCTKPWTDSHLRCHVDLMRHEKWRDDEIAQNMWAARKQNCFPWELAAFRGHPEPAFLAGAPVGGEGRAWCQELFGSTWQIVYSSLYWEKCSVSCQFVLCPVKVGNHKDTTLTSILIIFVNVGKFSIGGCPCLWQTWQVTGAQRCPWPRAPASGRYSSCLWVWVILHLMLQLPFFL